MGLDPMGLDTDALVICKYPLFLFGSLHTPVHSNTNDDTPPNNEPFYVSLSSCTHTWVYP